MKHPANPLGLAVLTYLSERPMHPYELHKLLQDRDAGTAFPLSYGNVYGVVRQLAKKELIRPAATGRTGRLPKHTVYELTDAGRTEMDQWLRDLIARPRHEHQSFLAALTLIGALPPDDAVHLLEVRRTALAQQIDDQAVTRQKALDDGVHPLFLTEDELRLALLRTERDFVDDLIGRITDRQNGWAKQWWAALS